MNALSVKPEETKMAMSQAHIRASSKYNKTNYESLMIRAPKGYRDSVLKVAAAKAGVSLNEFVLSSVARAIKDAYPEIEGVDGWKVSSK